MSRLPSSLRCALQGVALTALSFCSFACSTTLTPAPPLPSADPARWTPAWALRRAARLGLQALGSSVAVTIASLPLVASAFHQISVAGLLSNVLCLPLTGLLTLLSAAVAACRCSRDRRGQALRPVVA